MDIQLPQHDLLLSPFCSHSVLMRYPRRGYCVRKSRAPICVWALQPTSFVCENIFAPVAHCSFIAGFIFVRPSPLILFFKSFLAILFYIYRTFWNQLLSSTKNRTTATTKTYTAVILIEIALFINKWAKLISL